jgi:endonuclease III
MRRRDKAERIGGMLDRLYPQTPIPLDHRDPFSLLVAVMLSAQTTDKKVNQVTPGLFSLADTPAKLAALPVELILERIRPLGLAPTKARNLKAMARQLLDLHGGEVPSDEAALEALPGVGHKTASVVRAQAFGLPAFPVDTHIHRLAARWGLSSGKNVMATERDLKRAFAREEWNKRHLQIIFFGREHCPARGHDATACPICNWACAPRARAGGSSAAPTQSRVGAGATTAGRRARK